MLREIANSAKQRQVIDRISTAFYQWVHVIDMEFLWPSIISYFGPACSAFTSLLDVQIGYIRRTMTTLGGKFASSSFTGGNHRPRPGSFQVFMIGLLCRFTTPRSNGLWIYEKRLLVLVSGAFSLDAGVSLFLLSGSLFWSKFSVFLSDLRVYLLAIPVVIVLFGSLYGRWISWCSSEQSNALTIFAVLFLFTLWGLAWRESGLPTFSGCVQAPFFPVINFLLAKPIGRASSISPFKASGLTSFAFRHTDSSGSYRCASEVLARRMSSDSKGRGWNAWAFQFSDLGFCS